MPWRDRDWHFAAVRERYTIPAPRSVTGRVRASSTVVRVTRTRRQGRRTTAHHASDGTTAARRVTTRFVAVYRVTVIRRRRLVRYDHRSAWPVVLGLRVHEKLYHIIRLIKRPHLDPKLIIYFAFYYFSTKMLYDLHEITHDSVSRTVQRVNYNQSSMAVLCQALNFRIRKTLKLGIYSHGHFSTLSRHGKEPSADQVVQQFVQIVLILSMYSGFETYSQ